MILKLTQGLETIVDDDDFEILSKNKWKAHKSSTKIYARRSIRIEGVSKSISMHRLILKCPEGFQVDHIDGDSLNNQKHNLRLCTAHQNQIAFRKRSIKYTSKFRGVSWAKNCKKWAACMTYNWKKIHIGLFNSETEAAIARDSKALEMHGEFAQLNFPKECLSK